VAEQEQEAVNERIARVTRGERFVREAYDWSKEPEGGGLPPVRGWIFGEGGIVYPTKAEAEQAMTKWLMRRQP
jgi:hypothetical protein